MTLINPINVNTQGIGAKVGYGAQKKEEKELEKKAETQASPEKTQVSADKVFDFLSASSISVVPKKTVDPSKYVDDASAARIAAFMQGFEDTVAANLSAISADFPKMSEGAKTTLALKQADKKSL